MDECALQSESDCLDFLGSYIVLSNSPQIVWVTSTMKGTFEDSARFCPVRRNEVSLIVKETNVRLVKKCTITCLNCVFRGRKGVSICSGLSFFYLI